MKKITSFLLLLAFAACLNSACSSDPVSTINACNDLAGLATTFTSAATAYTTNPTTANCNAYKTAGTNYLNALKKCSTASAATISSTQASIDALRC
jgi:hypothetical protein